MKKYLLVMFVLVLLVGMQAFSQSGKSEFIRENLLKTDIGTSVAGKPLYLKILKSIKLDTYEGPLIDVNAGDSIKVIDIYSIREKYVKWVVMHKSALYYLEMGNYQELFFDTQLMDKCSVEAKKRIQEREQKSNEKFVKDLVSLYGKKTASDVIKKQVEIDMPKGAVLIAWGEPDKETTLKSKKGVIENLYYFDKKSMVTIFNGKVSEIATSK